MTDKKRVAPDQLAILAANLENAEVHVVRTEELERAARNDATSARNAAESCRKELAEALKGWV